MPLIDLDRPLYIRRDRFYVDSEARTANSRDLFDIEIDLDKRYENVQSVEVSDYNFTRDISPVFIAKTQTANGNNLLDVRMINTLGPETIEFTVVFDPERRYTDENDLTTDVLTQLNDQMDAQGDPFFNTANNVTWSYNTAAVGGFGPGALFISMKLQITGAVGADTQGFFLFGSGPSRGNTPARIFGFDEEDTIVLTSLPPPLSGITITNGPTSYHLGFLHPFRYVDVFIRESEASFLRDVPTARVFVGDEGYIFTRETTSRPRLYTNPLHYADALHIKLRLEGDRVPPELSTVGWDLGLDILQLSNEPKIPSWVDQKLIYP